MRESIFKSCCRLFFSILTSIVGVFLALFLLVTAVDSLGNKVDGDPDIEYSYDPKIVPNGNNVRKSLASTYPVILKLNIEGEIGTEFLNKKTIDKILVESRERAFKDDRVKAILLNINTPGGAAIDSNTIYLALKSYKKQYNVPIYAYVDGLCASGGVYVACAADKIFASDVSLIGSVGVLLGPLMNYYKLMEKVGVISETFSAGKDKDEMNPFRKWKANEGENYKTIVAEHYEHFVNVVVTNRPRISEEQLRNEYGANVFVAKTAQDLGYIDEANYSLNEVLTLLAKEIGIDDDMYQVVEFQNNNWLVSLFKGKVDLNLLKGQIKHSVDLPLRLDPKFANQPLYLYQPE